MTEERMKKHSAEIIMRQVYQHFTKSESIKETHMPHSSVYYVKSLIKYKFDKDMSVYEVEALLKDLKMLTKGGNPILTEEDKVRAHKNRLRRAAKKAGIYKGNK